jgi:hypothetical protein
MNAGNSFLKIIGCLSGLLGGTAMLSGADTNQMMTKLVYRDISTNHAFGTFAAQAKTLYRMGEKYGRTEEAPDTANGTQGLFIVNEPDAWMINLADRTGMHMVDSGPSFVFHAPLLSPEQKSPADFDAFRANPVSQLELGKEMEFFRAHQVASSGQVRVGSQDCDQYKLVLNEYTLELLARAGTGIPYQLKVLKGDRLLWRLQYDVYLTNEPPDLSLFQPPKGLKISEQRPPAPPARR